MKYLLVFTFVFLAIYSIQAQPKVNPDGYNVFYYPNNVKSSEGNMRQGKPDGLWKTYYTTGRLKSIGIRTAFQLDSTWVFYSEMGDTTEKISYLNGKKNGFYFQYDTITTHGKHLNYISAREMYISDVKSGMALYFFYDGQIKSEVMFVEGKKHGYSKEYNQQGVIISIKKYHYDQLTDIEKINRTDQLGIKQGIWKYFGENRQLIIEEFYIDGKLDGMRKFYDDNGKLTRTEKYKMGELLTDAQANETRDNIIIKDTHYPDGKIYISGSYMNEIPVGIHRTFDTTGVITESFVFDSLGVKQSLGIVDIAGKKQGSWKDLFSDGNTRAEGVYKNDKRTGAWKFYYPNGKLEQDGKYVNGKPDGEWKWYYPNGQLAREEYFEDGIENGDYAEYDEKGNIIAKGYYENGMKEGEWLLVVAQNKLVGNFSEDYRNGLWKYYTLSDILWFEGKFSDGEPDGKQIYYYPNGMVKEEHYYIVGRKEKSWKYYSPEGIVTTTIDYKNDEEIKIDGQKLK